MKKVIAILLSLVVMSSMAVTAFAANETSASTTVSYTVENGYTVNIPASINLNETRYIDIQASNVLLPAGNCVVVKLDSQKSNLHGSYFFMSGSTGGVMECDLWVGSPGEDYKQKVASTSNVIAKFENQSEGPSEYGRLYFEPIFDGQTTGTYTSTIYFDIGIESA